MTATKPRHTEAWNRALDAVGKSHDRLISHNICVGARRTSLRLDALTWRLLHEVAQREGVTVHELCTAINSEKPRALSLTVAIRVAVLRYHHDAATAAGHRKAGHGKKVH